MEECTEVIAAVALVTSDSLPNVPEWVKAFPKIKAVRASLSGLANDGQYRENLIAALKSLDITLEICLLYTSPSPRD